MNPKYRINWLLILQGWAMLLVVVGHSQLKTQDNPEYANVLFRFAYSFHMPLFIFVSGFLFYLTRLSQMGDNKRWSYTLMIKEKLFRLGIPYLFFSFFAMILKTVFSAEMNRPSTISFLEYINSIVFPGAGPLAELWFLTTIMWFFLLGSFWNITLKHVIRVAITTITCIILYFYHIHFPYFAISTALHYTIFFYLGIQFAYYLGSDLEIKTFVALFFLGLALYISFIVLNFKFGKAVAGIIFSIGMAGCLDYLIPMIFRSFRNYTYQIFLLGIFFQYAIKIIYKRMPSNDMIYFMMYILCILVGIFFPVLLAKCLEKINNPYLSSVYGLGHFKKANE